MATDITYALRDAVKWRFRSLITTKHSARARHPEATIVIGAFISRLRPGRAGLRGNAMLSLLRLCPCDARHSPTPRVRAASFVSNAAAVRASSIFIAADRYQPMH